MLKKFANDVIHRSAAARLQMNIPHTPQRLNKWEQFILVKGYAAVGTSGGAIPPSVSGPGLRFSNDLGSNFTPQMVPLLQIVGEA